MLYVHRSYEKYFHPLNINTFFRREKKSEIGVVYNEKGNIASRQYSNICWMMSSTKINTALDLVHLSCCI